MKKTLYPKGHTGNQRRTTATVSKKQPKKQPLVTKRRSLHNGRSSLHKIDSNHCATSLSFELTGEDVNFDSNSCGRSSSPSSPVHSPIHSTSPLDHLHTTNHQSSIVGSASDEVPSLMQNDSFQHRSKKTKNFARNAQNAQNSQNRPISIPRRHSSSLSPQSLFPPGYEHPYGDWSVNRMLSADTTSYDQIRGFKYRLPKMYNIGVDICDKHVWAGNGSEMALLYVNQETGKNNAVDYQFVSEQSNKVANGLRYMGIKQGDRIAFLMSQSIEVAIMHAACYKVGAVAVPLSILFGPEALEYRIKASGAKALFVEPTKTEDLLPILDKISTVSNVILSPHLSSLSEHDALITSNQATKASDLKGLTEVLGKKFFTFSEILQNGSKHHVAEPTTIDDPALIIFTSGTTGNPKAAVHRQSVLLGHLGGTEFFYDLWPQKNDLIFTGSDVSWIGGLLNTLLTSMHHKVPVLLNRAKKFDADYMFQLLETHNVTTAFLPPTALKMMKEVPNPRQKYNYNVRAIGSGGEALGESMLTWGQETFGTTINEFYGQTECNLSVGNSWKLKPVKSGSMGVAIPGQEVAVVDDYGVRVQNGHVGQIAVKGPHPIMFSGYLNNPEATAEKFVKNPQTGDSWLLTGDLGREDDEGYFYYVGRNDDIISSAGYRIGPAEVEMSLMHHPVVSNACVIGAPDELRNEVVKAFVVPTPQAQSSYFGGSEGFKDFIKANPHGNYDLHPVAKELQHDLMNFVKKKLAKHEFPRQLEFVDSLPMTTTGKIIRKGLKKQEYERYYRALGKEVPDGMF